MGPVKLSCTYRVAFTLSPNGSNEMLIRFTPFKLTSLMFLAMADRIPPDLAIVPVFLIDIVIYFRFSICGTKHSLVPINLFLFAQMSQREKCVVMSAFYLQAMMTLASVRRKR